MGAFHEKLAHSLTEEVYTQSPDVLDADYQATPSRGSNWLTRQLPVDPRSPTDNINRTPIIVDKTPDTYLDPRSPTPGVERTPLAVLMSKNITSSGSGVQERDSMCTEDAEMTPVLEPEMTTSQKEACSPDSGCSLQDMLVDVDDSSPLIQSTDEQNSRSADTTAHLRLVSHPKQLFPSVCKPSVTKVVPVIRSPLTSVVMATDSPLQIVQAKQRKQVARSGGGFRGLHDPHVDKENVIH